MGKEIFVGELLRADLFDTNISQNELGEKLGLTQQAIGLWISRNSVPKKWRSQLLDFLGKNSRLASIYADGGKKPEVLTRAQRDFIRQADTQIIHRLPQNRRSVVADMIGHLGGLREMNEVIGAEIPGHSQVTEHAVGIGQHKLHFDYVSSNLVVNVQSPVTTQGQAALAGFGAAARKLLDMAAAKRHDKVQREYLFIAVVPGMNAALQEDMAEEAIAPLRWRAEALNISVITQPSYAHAGRCIIEMEMQRMAEDMPCNEVSGVLPT